MGGWKQLILYSNFQSVFLLIFFFQSKLYRNVINIMAKSRKLITIISSALQ